MKAEKSPQGGFFAKKYRRKYMYARLDRLRAELKKAVIKRDAAEEKVKQIEAKLKEEENRQIVCNVASYNMSPEELAEFNKVTQTNRLLFFNDIGDDDHDMAVFKNVVIDILLKQRKKKEEE